MYGFFRFPSLSIGAPTKTEFTPTYHLPLLHMWIMTFVDLPFLSFTFYSIKLDCLSLSWQGQVVELGKTERLIVVIK